MNLYKKLNLYFFDNPNPPSSDQYIFYGGLIVPVLILFTLWITISCS